MGKNNCIMPIGGYFEWEFPPPKPQGWFDGYCMLNSGRHSLEYILKGLEVNKIYIALYSCDVILKPLKRLGIPYEYYNIDFNLEISEDIDLHEREVLLYTNYFGIKDNYVKDVVNKYGGNVIIDNAQALFCLPYASHQFYSPRKFIGMPDGGMAVTSIPDYTSSLRHDESNGRCSHLLKRTELIPSAGYHDFKSASLMIEQSHMSKMSIISQKILESVDFENIKKKRRDNFKILHDALKSQNRMFIPDMDTFACPMVYPFMSDQNGLRDYLIENDVFVATYWPNVLNLTHSGQVEETLVKNIVPLPIDQRYGDIEMEYILDCINTYLSEYH